MKHKDKCSVCMEKDAKIVMLPHWKTGLVQPFVEGTCGDTECIKEYNMALEIGYELAKEEAVYEYLEQLEENR